MYRLGSVSYLNAKPLIYGLERDPAVKLGLDVPSGLLGGLRREEYDVALLPVIDYQRMPGLRMLTCGGIGSDGPTLTVRIFSHVPFAQIRNMACDTDSHTSVALSRVILAERFGTHPAFVDLKSVPVRRATVMRRSTDTTGETPVLQRDVDAVLLIGDKVITQAPANYEYQIDLGEQWKILTGLPFLFAAWMAREAANLGDLPERLETARRLGLVHIDEIVQTYGVSRGWPADLARDYLTRHLQFDVGPKQIEAVRLFHQLAAKHGAIEPTVRELRL